jgi:hypothetical protein
LEVKHTSLRVRERCRCSTNIHHGEWRGEVRLGMWFINSNCAGIADVDFRTEIKAAHNPWIQAVRIAILYSMSRREWIPNSGTRILNRGFFLRSRPEMGKSVQWPAVIATLLRVPSTGWYGRRRGSGLCNRGYSRFMLRPVAHAVTRALCRPGELFGQAECDLGKQYYDIRYQRTRVGKKRASLTKAILTLKVHFGADPFSRLFNRSRLQVPRPPSGRMPAIKASFHCMPSVRWNTAYVKI